MRPPPTPGLDWTAASKAERHQLGRVFQGTAGRRETSYWGLGIIWAVLAWPLNGGMKAVVCLSAVSLCGQSCGR